MSEPEPDPGPGPGTIDPLTKVMMFHADDPLPSYHEMLDHTPVVRSQGAFGNHGVMISRYEDVLWALKHPEVFSSKDVVKVGNDVPLIPLSVDPPDHAQYRRILDPQFSPRKMAALEPEMRALVNGVIDTFVTRGECDFHDDFATPLPSTFFITLMGLPHSDLPMFLRWRDNTIRPKATAEESDEQIRARTGQEITAYFEAAIAERRARPDDRLITALVNADMEGRPLTHAELLGACHLLMLGGLDTVTATLDCMIAYLARHPDRRQVIVDDPALIPAAVEEMLRRETPVMMVPRAIRQDVEIAGVQCKAGDGALLMLGAGNVDPTEFDDPDDARFDRSANRHLAFGGGPHRCLGSHLARLELRVAIEEFHRRIPEYRIPDGVDIQFSGGIRQAESLPLVFTAST